ncbi:MAG TPA: condensin subunit MukF [Polyangiaceae bacterium]|nr:condensin subunit MukF [Polyangiaceae bacterium]
MDERAEEPSRLIQNLAGRAIALELGSLDLCFVAALRLRSRTSETTSFSEQELVDAYRDVCALTQPEASGVARRATAAIQRLRDQRLLSRVDGAGVVRSGAYALTRLATSIVDFYLEEEALTGESLTLLLSTLHASLVELRDQARASTTSRECSDRVVGPLRVTIRDLVDGIERRQRGLDLQQERFQQEISKLLSADWFDAVARCQDLLEETTTTLRELNAVLLRDTHTLVTLLEDIRELAEDRGAPDANEACRRLSEQLERIAAWGSARQHTWSEYYQYVHRFLRDVVRLDPTRALTERLRAELGGKAGRSYSLVVATQPPLVVPREVTPPRERPPLERPRAEREKPLQEAVPDERDHALAATVQAVLAGGARTLSSVTEAAVSPLPEGERFSTAGRVAEVAARLAKVESARERPWTRADEGIWIEEWSLTPSANEK